LLCAKNSLKQLSEKGPFANDRPGRETVGDFSEQAIVDLLQRWSSVQRRIMDAAMSIRKVNSNRSIEVRGAHPESSKDARSGRRMNKTANTNLMHTPSFSEAALQEALAGFSAPRGESSTNSGAIPVDAQAQAALAPKTVAQVLGEITWLMTQSPRHKVIPLGDLEWLLMPAILLRQFRIFYKGEQPVGVALWALADEFVARRIDAGDKRLAAVEWKSGTNMRIIELVAPFGGEAEMRGQIDKEQQKISLATIPYPVSPSDARTQHSGAASCDNGKRS
jgi:cytolysin-activating lysine-acyltransferase